MNELQGAQDSGENYPSLLKLSKYASSSDRENVKGNLNRDSRFILVSLACGSFDEPDASPGRSDSPGAGGKEFDGPREVLVGEGKISGLGGVIEVVEGPAISGFGGNNSGIGGFSGVENDLLGDTGRTSGRGGKPFGGAVWPDGVNDGGGTGFISDKGGSGGADTGWDGVEPVAGG